MVAAPVAAPAAPDGSQIDTEEEIVMIDFRTIKGFVPQKIRTIVENDNTAFVVDRQIYNELFFTLIQYIVDHVATDLVRFEHEYRNDKE